MVALGRQRRQALARQSSSLLDWGRINTYWSWSWGNTSTVKLMKKHWRNMRAWRKSSIIVWKFVRRTHSWLAICGTAMAPSTVSLPWCAYIGIFVLWLVDSLESHLFSQFSLAGLGTSRVLPALNDAPPGSSTWTPHFPHFFSETCSKDQKLSDPDTHNEQ